SPSTCRANGSLSEHALIDSASSNVRCAGRRRPPVEVYRDRRGRPKGPCLYNSVLMNRRQASKTLETEGGTRFVTGRPTVLGIVGGGQLGRMLVLAAEELGVDCVALDPEPDSPAVRAGARGIRASLFDADALQRLVDGASVTTFEIEATDAEALQRLEDRGHRILPR